MAQGNSGGKRSAMGALRAAGINPLEVMQCIMAIVVNSGRTFTLLVSPSPLEDDDDDEAIPDDMRDRIIGYLLDNILLGFLPIDEAGKPIVGASMPNEVLTVGGTPISVVQEGQSIVLVDPLGTRSAIRSIVSRSPKIIGYKVERALMVSEWFGEEPLSKLPGSRGVDRFQMLQPSSVAHLLGEWETFELDSARNGKLKVRSLLGDEELRRRAQGQQLFRVRCALTPHHAEEEGIAGHMRAINRIEDSLAMKLAIANPRGWPIGVVSGEARQDFYYSSDDGQTLADVIRNLPTYPFDVSLVRLTGDTTKILDQLAPP